MLNFDGVFLGGSPHPIFARVTHLFQGNGQSVSDTNLLDPQGQVLVSQRLNGLYAVYETAQQNAVPEPATLTLLVVGAFGMIPGACRRRSGLRSHLVAV